MSDKTGFTVFYTLFLTYFAASMRTFHSSNGVYSIKYTDTLWVSITSLVSRSECLAVSVWCGVPTLHRAYNTTTGCTTVRLWCVVSVHAKCSDRTVIVDQTSLGPRWWVWCVWWGVGKLSVVSGGWIPLGFMNTRHYNIAAAIMMITKVQMEFGERWVSCHNTNACTFMYVFGWVWRKHQ